MLSQEHFTMQYKSTTKIEPLKIKGFYFFFNYTFSMGKYIFPIIFNIVVSPSTTTKKDVLLRERLFSCIFRSTRRFRSFEQALNPLKKREFYRNSLRFAKVCQNLLGIFDF